jgi:hypothetical protein
LIAGAALLLRGSWKLDHVRDVAEMMPAKKTGKKSTAEDSSGVPKRGKKA